MPSSHVKPRDQFKHPLAPTSQAAWWGPQGVGQLTAHQEELVWPCRVGWGWGVRSSELSREVRNHVFNMKPSGLSNAGDHVNCLKNNLI